MKRIELIGVEGLPEVKPGDDLGELISAHSTLQPGDVVVVAQKVVSKSEGRIIRLEDVAHRRWLVASDPEEHIEQLRPYLDLGFSHLVFHAPGDGQAHFLELYGSQILPRIRKQWS